MSSDANIGQWKELFERTLLLKELDPWEHFGETDLLRVETLLDKDSFWVSFTKNGGYSRGFSCCMGLDGLCGLLDSLDGRDEARDEARLYGQNSMAAFFGSREDLTPYDLEVIKETGVEFSLPGDWLYFRRFEPGYIPWTMTRAEIMLLTDLVVQITQAVTDFIGGKAEAFFSLGNVLARRYDEKTMEWITEAEKLQYIPRTYHSEQLEDELMMARILKRQLVDARLELDVFRLPVPLHEEAYTKPFYPGMALLADAKTGQLVEFEVFTPTESETETVVSLILGFIEKYGRPLIFYIQNLKLMDMLGEFSERSRIPLRRVSFLPAINAFKYAKGILCAPAADGSGTERDINTELDY